MAYNDTTSTPPDSYTKSVINGGVQQFVIESSSRFAPYNIITVAKSVKNMPTCEG